MLRKIQNRENATFIFSDDNPLITTIPARAKLMKASKSTIPFSSEFRQNASPTEKDMDLLKQISQSHYDEYNWDTNIFINDAVKYKTYHLKDYVDPKNVQYCNGLLEEANRTNKSEHRESAIFKLKQHIPSDIVDVIVKKNVYHHCKHLVSKIRNSEKTKKDRNETINELNKYVCSVDTIVDAVDDVKEYITLFKIDNIRCKSEDIFITILRKNNIALSMFFRYEILMLSRKPVVELLEEEIFTIHDLRGLNLEKIEYVCYDEEILETLKTRTIEIKRLLNLLNHNFSEFDEARENYSTSDILDRYKENHLHLRFMAGDPDDIILENSDNAEIVIFGIDNYEIDIQSIRDCPRPLGENLSYAYLIDFDVITGAFEEYHEYC